MQDMRSAALRARQSLSTEKRITASEKLCGDVVRSREFRSASNIACYFPMRYEVDARAIIERAWCAKKRIFVPVLRNSQQMLFQEVTPQTQLQKNTMSIWEPQDGYVISPRKLDLVITPTVAFDHHGHRIGMGGGYYDRCFSFLRHRRKWLRPKLVGVAFQCQEFEEITPNPWDIRLYRVFSEQLSHE